ncbi:MAG TPA: hypothetical protein VMR14_23515 [Streptosporangiaceae bacterium]|nr:hypothetical protein [Streptosporangiaceae bacterium]
MITELWQGESVVAGESASASGGRARDDRRPSLRLGEQARDDRRSGLSFGEAITVSRRVSRE